MLNPSLHPRPFPAAVTSGATLPITPAPPGKGNLPRAVSLRSMVAAAAAPGTQQQQGAGGGSA